jgi:hypothetical protein
MFRHEEGAVTVQPVTAIFYFEGLIRIIQKY